MNECFIFSIAWYSLFISSLICILNFLFLLVDFFFWDLQTSTQVSYLIFLLLFRCWPCKVKTLDFYISLMTVGSVLLAIGSIVKELALVAIKTQYRVYILNYNAFLMFLSYIFFKDLFYFYWKCGYTERRDRKIFRLMISSPSEHNGRCYADPKPGASSGSLMWVQGPKALGCPRLLFQATGRELDRKQGHKDQKQCLNGILVCAR